MACRIVAKKRGYYSRFRLDEERKDVLIKKAKWDFYTVLPIVICLILMFIFNIIADINSFGDGTY